MKAPQINLFLIEPEPIVGLGFQHLVAKYKDLRLIRVLEAVPSGIGELLKAKIDVLVVGCPSESTLPLHFLRLLKSSKPDLQVCIFFSQLSRVSMAKFVEAGVDSFISRGDKPQKVVSYLRTLVGGGKCLLHLPEFATDQGCEVQGWSLEGRSRQIAILAANGLTDKEIGARLGLSLRTVEGIRQRLMKKLQLTRRVDLTKFALKEGLIDLSTTVPQYAIHPNHRPMSLC